VVRAGFRSRRSENPTDHVIHPRCRVSSNWACVIDTVNQRPSPVGFALLRDLNPGQATSSRGLSGSIVQTHRTKDIVVAFCRIEEKLDAASGLLPLISHNRLHNVALRLFVAGQNGWGAVS